MTTFVSRLMKLGIVVTLLAVAPEQIWADILYTNGSITGTVGAVQISPNDSVADSFTLASSATLTSAELGLWVPNADQPLQLDWLITTKPLDLSTVVASGTGASLVDNTFKGFIPPSEFDLYQSTFFFGSSGVSLSAGTYYLQLEDAQPEGTGSFVGWDETNSGSSSASSSSGSTIVSEAFTLLGTPSAVPEPSSVLLLGLSLPALVAITKKKRGKTGTASN